MKITVIGLGHVGVVAATCLADSGHDVAGVDVDSERVEILQAGKVPFFEPDLAELLQDCLARKRLRLCHTDDFAESLGEVALVATGTPPTHQGDADLGQVRAALEWVSRRDDGFTTVVMKSTVPPGTGDRLSLGKFNLRYVSNPEFLREGQAILDWQKPDRVVIGVAPGDTRSEGVVKEMYAGIDAPCVVTNIASAEMVKYAGNAFLATRISFINEIASLCESVGASIDAVSDGLAMDPRTGGRIHAGVGYGGSCFPKDVSALDHLALTTGVNAELLRSVITVNNRQRLLPLYALRERFNGAMEELRIAVLGLAFKPYTDDVREAPALDLINTLVAYGADVAVYDPQAMNAARPCLPEHVRFAGGILEAADQAQALVLMTEWEQFVAADWQTIGRRMSPPRFVFDGRNALDAARMRELGFQYMGVGRGAS